MADLAVGLSKAAVEALVNKFKSAIEEEEEQWQIVQRDMVFIIDEFEMMQSFLGSVDGERVKNIVVRTWVRQVRDLSYDVEDCIEFVLHLDTTKGSCWLRLLPSCGKTRAPLPIDEAVSEIKLLKARVEDVSHRNMRYNFIGDSGSKSVSQVQQKASSSTSTFDIFMDAANKMQRGLLDLVKLITMDDKGLQVISVCGTGGDHGKTSMIKNAYDDPLVRENFRCRAWVKVTRLFNPLEFIQNLVAQFYKNSCHDGEIIGLDVLAMMDATHDDLLNVYMEQVNKQRYLIILEDVISIVHWDVISSYLPDRKNGSRIIVSTHQLEIASLCTGKPYRLLELTQFTADHSICVFFKELSQRDEASDWGGPSAERKAVRDWVVNVLCVGCNPEADMLDERITSRCNSDKPHVVCVLGTSCVETSALVRTVYCRNVLLRKFQKYAWVTVSHPFDLSNFCLQLLCLLYEGPNLRSLVFNRMFTKECRKLLDKKRCLVIIDGLESKKDWDKIKAELISEASSSCIVVIARGESTATYCAMADVVCKINSLEADSARHMFNEKGFQRGNVRCPHWVDNLHLFGRDLEANELFNQMKNATIISLWGLPGVGKSALSRAVYYRHMLVNGFEKYAWVNVSHPFNLINLSQQLLLDLHVERASSEAYRKAVDVGDPIDECRKLLHDHRCLVIIDNLQSEEDWDLINAKLISGSSSCIVVITTKANVATYCAVTEGAAYHVKPLEDDASLHLWIKKVLADTTVCPDCSMIEEAKLILYKCGGLPKVIVALAGYLATQTRDVQEGRMRSLNTNFMHELETNPELDCLRGLLTWMHSYLDACPSYLKKFMLYVSIFPPDQIIRRGRLIRRWIAEGYSKGKDSNSLVKYAENLYEDLTALHIMNPAAQTSKVAGYYQVNGFFREYIVSRPMEEKIFFPLEVSALEKGHGGLNTEGMGQHLAVGRTWELDQILFSSLDFSRLRSLTVFQLFWPLFVSDRMRVLRVLDLENARDVKDSDLKRIGKLPARLKFLSLRGQREVSRLPDSVGGLMQLQTLDIRDTSIKTLPPNITKLRKLQYIRAGTTVSWMDDKGSAAEEQQSGRPRTLVSPRCGGLAGSSNSIKGGVKLHRGIKHLKALHTLGAVNVSPAYGVAIMDEIRFLDQLKKLELSGITRKTSKSLLCWTLDGLESLSLQFETENHFASWFEFYRPNLRSLKLYGNVDKRMISQRFVRGLPNLMKFNLEMPSLLKHGDIKFIGRLPSLRTLRLRVKEHQDGELQFSSAIFRKLQDLEIACKSKLHVKFDKGAMEKLELLKIHCCQGPSMQFSGLQHPASLRQVWIQGSFDNALKEALQQQLAIHPKQPFLNL